MCRLNSVTIVVVSMLMMAMTSLAASAQDQVSKAAKKKDQGGGDLVNVKSLSAETKGAFMIKFRKREAEKARGLFESTLVPVYPADADCPTIDHVFGEPWKGPIPNRFHKGADIPAPWKEPVLAMADGEVVAKFKGEKGFRGLQVVLRHAPEDTGLPVWVYSLYSHFITMPEVEIGQRVRMGDVLGPNGKSGVPGRNRGPHVHLTVTFSDSPKYARTRGLLIPVAGRFADPVALFRSKAPLDTGALTKLSAAEREVTIAHKRTTGEIVPAGAKIIWLFACEPK
jgi:murein DD-endopeptidase MepM/ murein hydrolase activator NlpD